MNQITLFFLSTETQCAELHGVVSVVARNPQCCRWAAAATEVVVFLETGTKSIHLMSGIPTTVGQGPWEAFSDDLAGPAMFFSSRS